MTSASDRKWRNFNCFFKSRGQVVVRRGHIRIRGWVIKTLEDQVGQFLLGCKCPVSRGIVVQGQDNPGDLTTDSIFKHALNINQSLSLCPEEQKIIQNLVTSGPRVTNGCNIAFKRGVHGRSKSRTLNFTNIETFFEVAFSRSFLQPYTSIYSRVSMLMINCQG